MARNQRTEMTQGFPRFSHSPFSSSSILLWQTAQISLSAIFAFFWSSPELAFNWIKTNGIQVAVVVAGGFWNKKSWSLLSLFATAVDHRQPSPIPPNSFRANGFFLPSFQPLKHASWCDERLLRFSVFFQSFDTCYFPSSSVTALLISVYVKYLF